MIIGISGGRGAGKSTISQLLVNYLPNSKLIIGDSYMHTYSKILEKDIFKKLGIEKNPNIFSYNYYFDNEKNRNIWINTIEKDVINEIENEITVNEDISTNHYIIIDWCFLPLCDFFKRCDFNICIDTRFDIREKRLMNRLLNKSDKTDTSVDLYTPEGLRKSIMYTDLSKDGFKFDYYINNNSTIEVLNDNVKELANNIIKKSKFRGRN